MEVALLSVIDGEDGLLPVIDGGDGADGFADALLLARSVWICSSRGMAFDVAETDLRTIHKAIRETTRTTRPQNTIVRVREAFV